MSVPARDTHYFNCSQSLHTADRFQHNDVHNKTAKAELAMTQVFSFKFPRPWLIFCFMVWFTLGPDASMAQESVPRSISGIYPHLAFWNPHDECGTGAVVPWAGRLWVITYAPHFPQGSEDKLYAITPDLQITAFNGSVGGTPANRMIHRETNQLLIGPYVIDQEGNVRVIPPARMPGRLTGNARHLFEPERKVYYATMEEGFYEVDLVTLEVTELFHDDQESIQGGQPADSVTAKPLADLPGYHGKGFYSGQGRVIYANNGEPSAEARRRPDVPSGCLAEWDGQSPKWNIVRRNQFCDVRGPGGIHGNPNPDTDPVWAIGWDHRSLILMVLDGGQWHTYRLPKASHTYDGAHGWNTEWPRIHDIGEEDMVMNMHGMFWRFPRTFSHKNSAGLQPRSTYLKVVGDYCRWGDRLVFGCDDTAKSAFLNTCRAKGQLAAPGQSNSNLWFARPSILDELGPPLGRGGVWANEDVQAHQPSDPYLFQGFQRRGVHVEHNTDAPVKFTFEIDTEGNGQWRYFREVTVPGQSAAWLSFDPDDPGIWIRVSTDRDCLGASIQFTYSNADPRGREADPIFRGLAGLDSQNVSGGIVHVRGNNLKTLAFAAVRAEAGQLSEPRLYELDAGLRLQQVDDETALRWTLDNCAIPDHILFYDAASIIYIDDDGQRWRLPRGNPAFDTPGCLGPARIDREVVTERDLFHCGGIFYELPARNAGGFAKIRPIGRHEFRFQDYCSYRGMLIFTGVESDFPLDNPHILRSDDGRVALWAGVIDDLWKLGKPAGAGGPWQDSDVQAHVPSDPYLMTGFDNKTVMLSHRSPRPVTMTLQVEIDGAGTWVDYRSFTVPAGESLTYPFPPEFSAYWIRAVCDQDTKATVRLKYE